MIFFYGLFMDESLLVSKGVHPIEQTIGYVEESIVVNLPGNTQVSAVCYNLPAAKLMGTNPEYAAALLALATKLGLPDV